jgi:ureidoacrylate peracid hydrolase
MTAKRSTLAELVDPRHTAILVIDMMPLFTENDWEPGTGQVIAASLAFIEAARANGVPLTFIRHTISDADWTPVWQRKWPIEVKEMYRPGGIANDFDHRFQPHPGDLEIVKARYSAFINTTLAMQLRARGIQTVIALGLITDICISSTIRDAFHNEFDTVTLSDCTATSTLARHEAALAALADCFGTVCPSGAVVAAWAETRAIAD